MLADYHVHSAYSDDSAYPMEQVVKDAIEKGLDEICFTDHVDYGIKPDADDKNAVIRKNEFGDIINVDYPRYFAELAALRGKYAGRIAIKRGLEFGIQTHTIDRYRELVKKYPLDFVILSIHQVGDREFWNQEFQSGKTQREYNERYYQELYDTASRFDGYSVLGHLDLIKRYDRQGIYPFSKSRGMIAEILKLAIKNKKGIEVNTSSFRYGLKELTPCEDILRLYLDLGGKIITIGSDSHQKEHLGAYIAPVSERLRGMGYTRFCTFSDMEPVFHTL